MKTTSDITKKYGIETDNLDLSINPGEDFYMYACGRWKKAHPLKGEFARFGTFDLLRENAREQLKDLIMNLSENPESKIKGSIAQKVSDIYNMAMDAERINSLGAKPILPMLKKIETYKPDEFTDIISWMHNGIASPFFGTGVGTDARRSDMNVMHIGEVGLGLGDRDYYLEKSDRNDEILKAYEIFIKRILELTGYQEEDRERIWSTLIRVETEFARHKMTREERRNPLLRYNMMSMDEIKERYPNIEWERYFKGIGIEEIDKANIVSTGFMEFLNSYLPTLSEREKKDLLILDIIESAGDSIGDDYYKASFEFSKVMSGVEEMEPRWKRAMGVANSMFGEAVGKLYVEKYFPEENKRYMLNLVENLRKALGKHIDNLSWMSEATKEKAREKLASFKVKIGYPDKWKDYSEIDVDPEMSFQENLLRASRWYAKDNYSKLNKPVDKEEWHMYPQTVNAYYNPTSNEICFPAGILQAPYFDVNADDALNYGGIGVVIGHEMTHGFDDSGRRFDKDGNLNEWWKEEDEKKFNELADKLVAQFDAVEVAPGVKANGRFTLGENIADQGGLRIAMTAYLDSRGNESPEEIGGFSPQQRFYLSYANVWADNIRDAEILDRTQSDPHSLGRNRVNVTLRNLEPFFEAFDIKAGDKMYRPEEERVIIW
ncbi:MAG: M13 family metallopeptidase [Muribaculaceae bacterium]|nr:M13 family metallopeptidase [Muribaculaceae bacterium]